MPNLLVLPASNSLSITGETKRYADLLRHRSYVRALRCLDSKGDIVLDAMPFEHSERLSRRLISAASDRAEAFEQDLLGPHKDVERAKLRSAFWIVQGDDKSEPPLFMGHSYQPSF